MIHISKIRARYEESGQMGFIHHSNHLVWMELSRMNLFRECGINYRELETGGFLLPVTKAVTKYVSPAFFDDEIAISSAFTKITHAKIRVDYLIHRNENDLICFGYTEHCLILKDNRKPLGIPDNIMHKLQISETARKWLSWRTL